MRVFLGTAKGSRLKVPKTKPNQKNAVRPVSSKVKEAIFHILGSVNNLRVLDVFAGTGAVGIEALSQGAKFCHFVELSTSVARLLQQNLLACHFKNQSKVWNGDFRRILTILGKKHQRFDLVFVDPPYDQNLISPTLRYLVRHSLLEWNARVVMEHSPRETLPIEENLEITDQRRYGQTCVSFLKFVV